MSSDLFKALFGGLIALILVQLDPFGVASRSQEISEEAFYRVYAPLIGERLESEPVVVLVTPAALGRLSQSQNQTWTWPLSFDQHAVILESLAEASPHAVFYDIAFYQDRGQSERFRNAIGAITGRPAENGDCALRQGADATGARVFLAAAQGAPPWKELCEGGAERVAVSWSGVGNGYPLTAGLMPTAAWALWQSQCSKADKQDANCPAELKADATMSVAWGVGIDGAQKTFASVPSECETLLSNVAERAALSLQNFGSGLLQTVGIGDAERNRFRCAYPLTITVDQIVLGDNAAELSKLLKDRLVIVGVAMPALGDRTLSPAHGQLPGVFLHAAALDNLLRFGNDMIERDPKDGRAELGLTIMAIAVVLGLFLAHRAAGRWLREHVNVSQRGLGPSAAAALEHVMWSALAWALAILIAFVAALIAFYWLRLAPINWLGAAVAVVVLTLQSFLGVVRHAFWEVLIAIPGIGPGVRSIWADEPGTD